MTARLALLSLLLLASAACGATRADGGSDSSVISRSSAPVLLVENGTGTVYEIFIMFTGVDTGQPLGTAGALRDTPLQLVDIPLNGSVRFRARPMGAAVSDQVLYSDMVELDGRHLTWSLGSFRSSRVTYRER